MQGDSGLAGWLSRYGWSSLYSGIALSCPQLATRWTVTARRSDALDRQSRSRRVANTAADRAGWDATHPRENGPWICSRADLALRAETYRDIPRYRSRGPPRFPARGTGRLKRCGDAFWLVRLVCHQLSRIATVSNGCERRSRAMPSAPREGSIARGSVRRSGAQSPESCDEWQEASRSIDDSR